MLNRIPRPFRLALLTLMLGTCGFQISRVATAEPVTVPMAKDVAKAERVAAPRVAAAANELKALQPPQGAMVGGNGVVEPAQRETRVAAQVSAVVQTVHVHEGDRVQVGDVLVTLAQGVEVAAVQAAEAEVAAEQANLERVRRGPRSEDREALEAEAAAARARWELSIGLAQRAEKLARTGAATEEERERTHRQAQTDAASYQALDARARAARAGSRAEDIGFARARLAAAEARLTQARATLARLSVRAPVTGEVLQVKVREGELYTVQSADPLMLLGDTRRLRVRMDVDERDVAQVVLGAPAYVTADAFGDRKFAGKVAEIGRRFGRKNIRTDDPLEKNDTKVLEVVIDLNSNELLIPGQRVTAYVTSSEGLATAAVVKGASNNQL